MGKVVKISVISACAVLTAVGAGFQLVRRHRKRKLMVPD